MGFAMKRVYDEVEDADGFRVLVDRLWPRGVAKADLPHDLWLRDAAPSPELRKWFGHDQSKFEEFSQKYRAELDGAPALGELLEAEREHGTVTLLYAAKDSQVNHVVVLIGVLNGS